MSYYERPRFQLTNHAIERARSRLNLPKDVTKLRLKINELLNKSFREFTDRGGFQYFRIPDRYGFYFIVNMENVVITVTEIKPGNKIEKFN